MNKKYIDLTITFVLLVAFNISSKTFIVNKNNTSASDTNPGTMELPFKTIQEGINVAEAGDTVLVMPGLYTENLVIRRSGNAESGYIVLKSYKKLATIIDGSNIPKDKLIYWHGTSDGGINKNYIIFDGFEIENARRWAFWIQGAHGL